MLDVVRSLWSESLELDYEKVAWIGKQWKMDC